MRSLCLAFLIPFVLEAQSTSVLLGSVVTASENKPVAGAEVTVAGKVARANWGGDFRIAEIPSGPQEVTVRRLGFKSITVTLDFLPGRTLEREFVLDEQPVPIDSVKVEAKQPTTGRLGEFEEHRRAGFGHFITPEELRKQDNRRMAEVLQKTPGLTVRLTDGGAAFIEGGRGVTGVSQPLPGRNVRGCDVTIWLDGVKLFDRRPQEPRFNINQFSVDQIGAVEYYPGGASMPAKYQSMTSGCGVLVLWTRDR